MTPQQSQARFNRSRTRRRISQICIGFLAIFVLLGLGAYHRSDRVLPPTYEKWQAEELALPQHNVSLPFPEGATGRYLYFANRYTGIGWGNYLQEALLNAYLAEKSDRTFVFDNYTWSTSDAEAVRFGLTINPLNQKLIPSRIPFSAIITGAPFGGGLPDPSGPSQPRSVRKEFYDLVCPKSERFVLSSEAIASRDSYGQWLTAQESIERWATNLKSISARCVEITDGEPIFNWPMFHSTRNLMAVWPDLKQSPVITTLEWSPLVHEAYLLNQAVFDPRVRQTRHSAETRHPGEASFDHNSTESVTVPGLLALHIRRGDFDWHCRKETTARRTPFNAFNSFPESQDQFTPPDWGLSEPNAWDAYRPRCFPTMDEIVKKVDDVRRDNPGLHSVYVLSNAPRDWVDDLLSRLNDRHPWRLMGGSRQLKLTSEQRYIAQSIDMLIAQRAQVFIGNGFSSLTSNVNMLRMSDGLALRSNRFW